MLCGMSIVGIFKKKKGKQAVWLKHWLDKEHAESFVDGVVRGQSM